MKKLVFATLLSISFLQQVFSKDLELILYKNFLQKLMDMVFPINISEAYAPGSQTDKLIPLGYKIDINNPVLSIQPKYIQIDSVVSFSSIFGNQTFPSRCKLIPTYNPADRNIELKVIEGKVDLEVNSNGKIINLGSIDLSAYISNIKIPLEANNISVKNKSVKPQCKNVTFQLLEDRIIVNSEMVVEPRPDVTSGRGE